uniref:Ovule protein n=1 Tax=Elaeophora elaphi TaxID=1147741 RepID=A0A0R3RUT2_9BILA
MDEVMVTEGNDVTSSDKSMLLSSEDRISAAKISGSTGNDTAFNKPTISRQVDDVTPMDTIPMDMDVTPMDKDVPDNEYMLAVSPKDKTMEVDDQVVMSRDDSNKLSDESVRSVDNVMSSKDKSMEMDDQIMMSKSDSIMLSDESMRSVEKLKYFAQIVCTQLFQKY